MQHRLLIPLLLSCASLSAREEWYAELEVHDAEAIVVADMSAASREAAEAGDAAAQFQLARCYFAGTGIGRSLPQAMKWLRKSADQGYADAQCHLGECYARGTGVEQNVVEACRWWVKAASQHHAEAMYHLGMAQIQGEGVRKSDQLGIAWLERAAARRCPAGRFS